MKYGREAKVVTLRVVVAAIPGSSPGVPFTNERQSQDPWRDTEMFTYTEARDFMARARDKSNGRPLGNNTRMYERTHGETPVYAIQLHSTDVVTIYPGNRYFLSTGGWETVTTAQRINEYGPDGLWRARWSDDGTWMVLGVERASDPEPDFPTREIPRPYHADDPGPEPVKSPEGCWAGTRHAKGEMAGCHGSRFHPLVPHEDDLFDGLDYSAKRKVEEAPNRALSVLAHTTAMLDGHFDVKRWAVRVVEYVDESNTYWAGREMPFNVKAEQCPHCAAFDALHRNWSQKMHGGYGIRHGGYAKWREMMDRYGDRAGWHNAYITEWRAVRDGRREWREWRDRNSASMPCMVNAEGRALRREVDARQKHQREHRRQIRRRDRAREAAERKERAVRRFKDKALEAWEENLPYDQRVKRIVRDIHLISLNGKAV